MKLIVLNIGQDVVAVFKPHGMFSVPSPGAIRPTLLDLVKEKFGKNIYAVHRLDRVTSGIVLWARSIFAKHALDNAFKKRLIKKTYYAICEGQAHFKNITINKPLKKIALNHKHGSEFKQIIDDNGDKAITKFSLIKKIDEHHCLIKAQPISGRMHQIRCHLSYINLPIMGDKLYGAKNSLKHHTIALSAVGILAPLPRGGYLNLDITHLFDINDYLSLKK